MMQLCCTKGVRQQFHLPDKSLFEPDRGTAALGNWYLNIVTIEGVRSLICMSERTLLSFMLFDIRKNSASNLGETFVHGLLGLLEIEGFGADEIECALNGCDEIMVTGTTNRKALGNLKDLADRYQWGIVGSGGFKHCDLSAITRGMNRMPQRNIGWGKSIDVARDLLGGTASLS